LQTDRAKTFSDGGHYADIVNTFVAAYKAFGFGLKEIEAYARNLANATDSISRPVFISVQNERQATRNTIDGLLTTTDQSKAPSGVNETCLRNAIGDLKTILDDIEMILLPESIQVNENRWYGDTATNTNLLNEIGPFVTRTRKANDIVRKLTNVLQGNSASYSRINHLDQTRCLCWVATKKTQYGNPVPVLSAMPTPTWLENCQMT
jgi:hypothetical protein